MAESRNSKQDIGQAEPQAPQWVDAAKESEPEEPIPLMWVEDGAEHPFEPVEGDQEPWLQVMGSMLAREKGMPGNASQKEPVDPEEEERRKMDDDLLKWV